MHCFLQKLRPLPVICNDAGSACICQGHRILTKDVGGGKSLGVWRNEGIYRLKEISSARCFTYPFPHCSQNMHCKYSLFNTYVFKIQIKISLLFPPINHSHTHTHACKHTHPFNLLSLKDDDIYNPCALPECTVKAKINAEGLVQRCRRAA